MLAASPKGTVPVVVLPGGTVIDQSLDIMRWALTHRDPEAWLARDDVALIAANDGPFKHALDRYKYPERHGVDPLAHRDTGVAFLREIEGRLIASHYLCGPARGFADAAIAPFIRQFAAVDRAWFDNQPLPRLQAWLAGFVASDLFETIMVRVAPWSASDPALAFPPPKTA